MAIEAANIGANFSDYVGNAGAAAGNFGVIDVDTKPLQNLAAYTVLFNRAKWEREKQETDANIAKLADLSNIELNSLRGKDREQAIGEFAKLQTKATEYARKIAKTPQEKMQNELEWQLELRAFNDNYKSGKDRAVTYQKRYNDIMQGTQDAKAKDAEIKILDEVFDKSDIATKISGVANFKTGTVDVPTPTAQKINTVVIGGNENISVDGSIYNPKTNAGIADAAVLNIKKLYPKAGTPEFDLLSEAEKNQAKIQATVESGGKVWVDATEPLNQVIKKYITPEGGFDAKRFENENASNTTLMNAYNALKIYDSYNRSKYEQAASGMFSDKGVNVKLPPNINAEDFKVGFVDFANGVTANQLVQSGMFAKYAGDTFTKKIQETDNAIQREGLKVQWGNLGLEREKMNKASSQDLLAADGVLREITDIVNKGDLPANQVDVVDSNTGRTKRVFKIGDPNILQKFGNIDKDGTTTNIPDEARYNPKTNEIDLVYFQRDEDGKVLPTQTGGSYIKESKTLNSRTWANLVTQRTFSGQDRGAVNEIIQSVITKNGGDLYKISKLLNSGTIAPETTTTTTTSTSSSSSSSSSGGFTREQLKASNKGWTDERIDQAVKAGKIKLKN